MTWGVENNVVERFGAAGVAQDRIAFARDTYIFKCRNAEMQECRNAGMQEC